MNVFKKTYIFFLIVLFPLVSWSQGTNKVEVETLVNKLRLANNSFQSKRTIKSISKLDAHFDLVLNSIKTCINYSDNVKKGYIEWRYAIDSIEYLTILFVPNNYSANKKYKVSFILHGAAMSYNPDFVKGTVKKDSYNCDSLESILVYPGCWVVCPWWREKQTVNLDYILKKLKLTYNIDENNIHLSGVSDGGTGLFYQANLNVTPWASFRPYISYPEGMYTLSDKTTFIKNFGNRPFLFISSEYDQLYPPDLIESFLKKMKQANNPYQYFLAKGYKHEMSWWPIYQDTIMRFYENNPRNSYPSSIFWQTDNIKYGRNQWVIINKLSDKEKINPELYPQIELLKSVATKTSGIIEVNTKENIINVKTINIKEYTLLLSPEQFNFEEEFKVYTNGKLSFQGNVTKDVEILLKWFKTDLDRTMLFGNELTIKVN